MILFQEDWETEGAFPDWNTCNQSFIEITGLYKRMGIQNYAWPLALYDRDLVGVDPYDPEITAELVRKITIECKINPLYFFREIARDPASSNDNPIRFSANRGILSAYWLFFNHIVLILTMIRQTGKSFGIDWLNIWLLNLGTTKTEISALLKDEKLRGRSLERLKAMELSLPYYMKQRSSKDAGNTEVLRVGGLGNTFKGYVPNRSPKMADLIGRGMTAAVIECDEFAYTACNWITVPVMLSSSLAAREVSRIKNEPYGTLLMTTAGKRDTPEGRYAYNFIQNAAVFSEKMFDCKNPDELTEMILKAGNGKDIRVNCTFNHRQLGKSDKWLADRLREAAQEDPIQIRADFFNEWVSGTLTSPFDTAVAEEMRNSEVTDYYTEIADPEAYAFRWYYNESDILTKLSTTHHTLSIDPSDAIGSDGIGIILRNTFTGEVAMASDISEANLIAFCRWIVKFLKTYTNVTLIIERRSTGAMIIDYLLEQLPAAGINPFKRIYNQVVQFKDDYPDRFNEIQNISYDRSDLYTKYKKYFGWATSGSGTTSRTELFGRVLSSAAKMTGSIMKDRKLILQTLGLEVRNGRIDHGDGEHDDLVISWLIGFWLISQGKNLYYYGIDSSKILSDNPQYKQQLKSVSHYEATVSVQTREMVERLTEELRNEQDEYVARRLEYDLELAINRLSEHDRTIIAVDDLINKLREERSRNARKGIGYGYSDQDYGSYGGYGGYGFSSYQ